MSIVHGVVMAGGRGTRFWPESTSQKPKQYLSIVGGQPLLYQTFARLGSVIEKANRHVVTTEDQCLLAKDAGGDEFNSDNIILEPFGRNTAPCLFLAFLTLLKNGGSPDDMVVVLPADHVILNSDGFQKSIQKALTLAKSEELIVTIGIPPHFPHTGYGYIHRGEKLGEGFGVQSFKEKPSKDVATAYLKSGEYFWNAGMFLAPLGVFLEEIKKCSPELYKFKDELEAAIGDKQKVKAVYEKLPEDSIDFAVMEKTQRIGVIGAEFDWNDLGSWDALEGVIDKVDNNVLLNEERGHLFIDSQDNIVFAPKQFVSLVGIKDSIIVSNDKVLMVIPKDRSQDIKKIVSELKKNKSKLI